MGLKKMAKKLSTYFERLESGKTQEIEPEHVRKVLEKLHLKEAELTVKLAQAQSAEARERYQQKLEITNEHIARAEYVLSALREAAP